MLKLKVLRNALIAGAASVILPHAAMAADPAQEIYPPTKDKSAWDICFGVTLASSYISRGVDYTNGLAVQPWINLKAGMFYVGYWGSNLNSALAQTGGNSWEHDLSVGITPELGPVSFDLGYVHYFFTPVTGDGGGEVYIKAEISPVDPLTLGAGFWYGTGALQNTHYTEVNASVDLIENFSASAAVGWVGGSAATPYTTWNAGLIWNPVEPLEIDFRYHDSPASAPGGGVSKFVVSATISTSLSALGAIQ